MWIKSSTVGLGCLSRFIALLAIRISTQSRTSPFFLGMTTNGETQGVGPSTFSMIPCRSRFSNSLETFFLMWNGMRRADWATGGTVSSMCSLTSTFFNFPIPLNTFGYCCTNLSEVSDCSSIQ